MKAILLNDKLFSIGEWNENTPLPDGAIEGDFDIVQTAKGRYVLANDYKTLRADEFPSIEEQLDMQYWDNINNTTVWKDTIEAIKIKYPKQL